MNYLQGELLYIDKPLGWTSFDAVKRLRSALSRRLGLKRVKVGHAGTLDPLATGVMIVATGRATKLIASLQEGSKEYDAELQLGATTPSHDLETEVDQVRPVDPSLTAEAINQALEAFRGTVMQVPPVFSAVKVDGRRAYLNARRGRDMQLAAKPVEISSLELTSFNPATGRLTLHVECGKGTYIRSLARDLGEALGCGAHLTALRRTRVGNAEIAQCLSLQQAVELIRTAPVEWPDWFQQQPAPDNKSANTKNPIETPTTPTE